MGCTASTQTSPVPSGSCPYAVKDGARAGGQTTDAPPTGTTGQPTATTVAPARCPFTGLIAPPPPPPGTQPGPFKGKFAFDPKRPRGITYFPEYDCRIRTLYSELGVDILTKIAAGFYYRVHHSVDFEFADAFSVDEDKATGYLVLYLAEHTGGPKNYSKKRGSLFPFLYSTHRLWQFKLTDWYWERWIKYFQESCQEVQRIEEEKWNHDKENWEREQLALQSQTIVDATSSPPSPESTVTHTDPVATTGSTTEASSSSSSKKPQLRFTKSYLPILYYWVERHYEWLSGDDKQIKNLTMVGQWDEPKPATQQPQL